jgi:hypothetical protein
MLLWPRRTPAGVSALFAGMFDDYAMEWLSKRGYLRWDQRGQGEAIIAAVIARVRADATRGSSFRKSRSSAHSRSWVSGQTGATPCSRHEFGLAPSFARGVQRGSEAPLVCVEMAGFAGRRNVDSRVPFLRKSDPAGTNDLP